MPTRAHRDLTHGQECNSFFIVRSRPQRREAERRELPQAAARRCHRRIEAVVWDEVEKLAPVCPSGTVVRVLGLVSVDERYGRAITVRRLRAAVDGEYDLADLLETADPLQPDGRRPRRARADHPAPAPA